MSASEGNIEQNEEKRQEIEDAEIKEMKQKSIFSLAWSIADNRCYMWVLQSGLIALCAFSVLVSYDQGQIGSYTDLNCAGNYRYLGPYKDDTTYDCPWPEINSIIRFIAPIVGLITGIITIFLQFCLGKRVLLDMNSFNETRSAGQKIEYFDIYSNCYFRFIRKVIGYMGYFQFISLGLDLSSFCIGREYGLHQLNISENATRFETVLYVSAGVAILLRLTHDAMYQRLYKRNFGLKLKLDFDSAKHFQGTTVREEKTDGGAITLNLEPLKEEN